VDAQARSEALDFIAPLADDRLGDDNQRARLLVDQHGRDELDGLAETHLVTQKSTWTVGNQLARDEPFDTFMLVG
jgi:hypothetical protein